LNILVVDDTPANVHLLTVMLKELGYKVRSVTDGKFALQTAKHSKESLDRPLQELKVLGSLDKQGVLLKKVGEGPEAFIDKPHVRIYSLGEVIRVGLRREYEIEGFDEDAQTEEVVLIVNHLGHS